MLVEEVVDRATTQGRSELTSRLILSHLTEFAKDLLTRRVTLAPFLGLPLVPWEIEYGIPILVRRLNPVGHFFSPVYRSFIRLKH